MVAWLLASTRAKAPATKTKSKPKPMRLRLSPLVGSNSVLAVPGLPERKLAEPGVAQALLAVAKETGANPDKLAAFISTRSGWDPNWGGAVQEGHTHDSTLIIPGMPYENDPDAWHRPGAGLMGFTEDGLAMAAYGQGVRSLDHIRQMPAIDQITGPLRSLLIYSPAIAKDPALYALFGTGVPIKNQGESNEKPTSLDTLASSPDSKFLMSSDNDYFWPNYGKLARGKSRLTLGDLRTYFYGPATSAAGLKRVS